MPPFVANGPDIPVKVLTTQQEGKLVLFCGAGLSRLRAGLPLFGGLVRQVYEGLSTEPLPQEAEAIEARQFDLALELLERRVKPRPMRQAVVDCLTTPPNDDLSAHLAVLDLARGGGEPLRLVTTNFDDLFEKAAEQNGIDLPVEAAPRLRAPRRSKWASLVHLHGRVKESGIDHRDLVLTSGDFGTAYLVERWASRFVTELFREFTVLFVGYRVDDPVIRYLMDALASERARGTAFSPAFALAPIPSRGKRARERERRAWASKGVTPIFYNEGSSSAHQHLYRTLRAWSGLSRGGLRSRRAVALDRADFPPRHADEDDARLVVWALSDPSGSVARQWAERPKAPSLDWLPILEESNDELGGSLLRLAPRCEESGKAAEGPPLVDFGVQSAGPAPLSPIARELGRWLARHLNSEDLLEWVVQRGAVLHPDFRWTIRRKLSQQEGIAPALRVFWQLVTSEEYAARLTLRDRWHHIDISRRLEVERWNAALRLEVLGQLAPVPVLRSNVQLQELLQEAGGDVSDGDDSGREKQLQDLVRIEMGLAGGDDHGYVLEKLKADPEYTVRLAELAHDLTSLLEEAMDLFAYLGLADRESDPSWHQLVSISDHRQNRPRVAEWTALIELVRDALSALAAVDEEAARALVVRWSKARYPVFRRLVLHAVTEAAAIEVQHALDLLLADRAAALWSPEVIRELLRFLRKAGARLSPEQVDLLVRPLLQGPPRKLYRDDLSHEEWLRARRKAIWIRLAKLRESGATLPSPTVTRLRNLERQYPWTVSPEHLDEFPIRRVEDWEQIAAFTSEQLEGMDVREIAELLRQETRRRQDLLDAWNGLAAKRPLKAIRVLRYLGRLGDWPPDVWHLALNFMPRDTKRRRDFWLLVSRFLADVPSALLGALVDPASQWLLAFTEKLEPAEQGPSFLRLWDALWQHARKLHLEPTDDPLFEALNRPPGRLALALLQHLWGERPTRGSLLSEPYRSRLSSMVEGRRRPHLLARVILSGSLASLFALDPRWCRQHLIHRFGWQNRDQAKALWEAYLHNPRTEADLFKAMKANLLRALGRRELSQGARRNLCRLIGFAAIQLPTEFNIHDSRTAVQQMGGDCLAWLAEALASLLQNAGDSSDELWRTRVGPWIDKTWPPDAEKRTPEVSDALAQVAIATDTAFPEAVDQIHDFLVPAQDRVHADFVLLESRHIQEHPESVLKLLDKIVPEGYRNAPHGFHDLPEVLRKLRRAEPAVAESQIFQRLVEFLIQRGQESE